MKTVNEKAGFKASIENGIDFTREEYEEKREKTRIELLDFDDFIDNVFETIEENNGDIDDAIFTANDAFYKL